MRGSTSEIVSQHVNAKVKWNLCSLPLHHISNGVTRIQMIDRCDCPGRPGIFCYLSELQTKEWFSPTTPSPGPIFSYFFQRNSQSTSSVLQSPQQETECNQMFLEAGSHMTPQNNFLSRHSHLPLPCYCVSWIKFRRNRLWEVWGNVFSITTSRAWGRQD